MPEFGGGRAVSDDDGIVVVVDGDGVVLKMCSATGVTELANGEEQERGERYGRRREGMVGQDRLCGRRS